ncbi:MAG TPA: sensor histidine kinase [Candidatus Sulfotelmatobacter sp.]
MGTDFLLSTRISESTFLRYALAVVAVIIALVLSTALNTWAGDRLVYVLILPAIAFSAWYCGIAPSVVATVLALVGAMYGPITSVHSLPVPNRSGLFLISVFVFSSALVIAMAESRRRQNEILRKAQGELEARVLERTADLDSANDNLRELSARLLQLQDDERRRIARELHDSVGQMLAALNMNLSSVRADVERLAKTASALTDSENLVQQMSTEVRTISHLLHPPLLDEAGLASALRWYVDGFVLRSKIKVALDLPEDFGRLPRESETAIFRVVQECLTNIHRHSESPIARIRLRQRDDQVSVEIEDKGKGIPPEKQEEMNSSGTPGVGIRGMRERLRQLGGTLEFRSNGSGTLVTVQLPLTESSSSPNAIEVTDTSNAAA